MPGVADKVKVVKGEGEGGIKRRRSVKKKSIPKLDSVSPIKRQLKVRVIKCYCVLFEISNVLKCLKTGIISNQIPMLGKASKVIQYS